MEDRPRTPEARKARALAIRLAILEEEHADLLEELQLLQQLEEDVVRELMWVNHTIRALWPQEQWLRRAAASDDLEAA